MKRSHHARLLPPLLLLLTALVRTAWLARFPQDPLGAVDAEGYHLLARNWLAGRGFSMRWEPSFCPTTVRTPLYPLFLAAIYSVLGLDPARVVPIQVLLEVVTTAWVLRLGGEVAGRRAGALAGLLYALNGTTQRYTGVLYAETLLLPLFTTALWVTVRGLRSARNGTVLAAGVLWGLAALTKPNVQYLALGAGLSLAVWPARSTLCRRFMSHVSRALLFALGLLMVVFPWLTRNYALLGRVTLSTAFEENAARVSAVAALAEARDLEVEPWTASWEVLYGELVVEAAQRYGWERRAGTETVCAEERRRHREVAQVAREVLWTHGQAALTAHLRGVARSLLDPGHRTWYPALTGRGWETTGVVADVWRRMGASLRIGAVGDALHALWLERVVRPPGEAALLWWGLFSARLTLWGAGLRGWRWLRRRGRGGADFLVGSVGYVLLLPGPIAYERFYLPAIPLVVILVGIGLTGRRHSGRGGASQVRLDSICRPGMWK
ncbi:MAG: ArnT family glycosyltransferase [Anaerolineae bacterium]